MSEVPFDSTVLTVHDVTMKRLLHDMQETHGDNLPFRVLSFMSTGNVAMVVCATDRINVDGDPNIGETELADVMALAEEWVRDMLPDEVKPHFSPVFALVPTALVKMGERIVAARVLSERADKAQEN